jgi:hypothetical protein
MPPKTAVASMLTAIDHRENGVDYHVLELLRPARNASAMLCTCSRASETSTGRIVAGPRDFRLLPLDERGRSGGADAIFRVYACPLSLHLRALKMGLLKSPRKYLASWPRSTLPPIKFFIALRNLDVIPKIRFFSLIRRRFPVGWDFDGRLGHWRRTFFAMPLQNEKQREGLALLVATTLQVRGVNLNELAAALPRSAERLDMRYQWISRVLGNELIVVEDVMAPFAREVLARSAAGGQTVIVMIDQRKVNDAHQMFMVSLRAGERALPLAWRMKKDARRDGLQRAEARA